MVITTILKASYLNLRFSLGELRQVFAGCKMRNEMDLPFCICSGILCFVLTVSEPVSAQIKQHSEKGTYYHQQYLPSEYGGHNQNWSVLENNEGLIYVGNGNGLMEYDGGKLDLKTKQNEFTRLTIILNN